MYILIRFYLTLVATLLLLYADDIVLLAGAPAHLQILLDALGDFSTTHFISASDKKSKIIVHSCSGAFSY